MVNIRFYTLLFEEKTTFYTNNQAFPSNAFFNNSHCIPPSPDQHTDRSSES
jgi:hypothetical protein